MGTVVNGTPDPVTGKIKVDHQYFRRKVTILSTLKANDGRNSTLAFFLSLSKLAMMAVAPPKFQSVHFKISSFAEVGDPGDFLRPLSLMLMIQCSLLPIRSTLEMAQRLQVVQMLMAELRLPIPTPATTFTTLPLLFQIVKNEAVRSANIPIQIGASSETAGGPTAWSSR